MKNIKINVKKLTIVLLTGFILISSVGCSNKKVVLGDNGREENSINNQDKQEDNSNLYDDEKEKITLTKSDIEVVSYFSTLKDNVDASLESLNQSDDFKDKLKGTFITIVDFIFYEGEINGIKFDDLTDGAKQNILETASTIDDSIMTKFPNYKEDISTTVSKAYNKASELIKSGANNIKDFSKEKLGEENYNSIIAAKDELVDYTKKSVDLIGDIAGTLWDKGKDKIKNWYEIFKNN